MNLIYVDRYLAWVTINVHPCDNLEFILHRAEERNGKGRNFYEQELERALNAELSKDGTGVCESHLYGEISYLIEAPSQEQLRELLPRIEDVVAAWAAKYNVMKMK